MSAEVLNRILIKYRFVYDMRSVLGRTGTQLVVIEMDRVIGVGSKLTRGGAICWCVVVAAAAAASESSNFTHSRFGDDWDSGGSRYVDI